jgi:hypothetical protein
MSERLKLILRILAFLGVAFVLGLLLFLLFFRTGPRIAPIPEVTPQADIPAGGLSPADIGSPDGRDPVDPDAGGRLDASPVADGGPTLTLQLTSSPIRATNISGGSAINYYDPADGRFYTIDSEGNVIELSSASFPNAETVEISNSGEVAAIEFPDGSNILFDFTSGQQTSLPSHWTEFEFSDDSDTVASKAIGIDPSNRSLIISSSDGARTTTVASLGTNESAVQVNQSPSDQVVGFSRTGETQTGFGREQIYLIGADGNDAGALVVEGGNFSAIWSPTGSHILYSVGEAANDYRASLWHVKGTGDVGSNRIRIDLETWVEKCTFFSTDTVYCAVPGEGVIQSGLSHYLVDAPDDVYRINTLTGQSYLVGSPVLDLQMDNLFVTADESDLYFTDQVGRLHVMRLN